MYPALIGKKIGMTQVFDEAGAVQPVTVVQAGPCVVLQVKTVDADGYDAVQIGFQDVRPQRASRPAVGHAARAKTRPKKEVREVRAPGQPIEAKSGETWTVEGFADIRFVDVVGTSKGKGYAGVMKRHGFKGMPASHGTERKHRHPGSISGYGSNAGRGGDIKKGKRMAGHMGAARVKARNCRLVGVDVENNLLLIKGPVPGPNGAYVFVERSKTAKAEKAS